MMGTLLEENMIQVFQTYSSYDYITMMMMMMMMMIVLYYQNDYYFVVVDDDDDDKHLFVFKCFKH